MTIESGPSIRRDDQPEACGISIMDLGGSRRGRGRELEPIMAGRLRGYVAWLVFAGEEPERAEARRAFSAGGPAYIAQAGPLVVMWMPGRLSVGAVVRLGDETSDTWTRFELAGQRVRLMRPDNPEGVMDREDLKDDFVALVRELTD